jgi:large-conductance mechanosensitive channel
MTTPQKTVTTENKHTVSIPEHGDVKVITKTTTRPGRRPKVTVLLDTDEFARDQVNGFVSFLREHAIVGLAVGFIIGTQAQTVVKQLVSSFIDPTFSLLFGEHLADRQFTLHFFGHSGDYKWGAMAFALLNLVFVLLSIYILIKVLKLDKLDKPKTD